MYSSVFHTMRRIRLQNIFSTFIVLVWLIMLTLFVYKVYIENVLMKVTFKRLRSNLSRHTGITHNYPIKAWLPPNDFDEPDDYAQENERFFEQNENLLQSENEIPVKMWFMSGGRIRPEHIKTNMPLKLWPDYKTYSDRIVDQLMYLPENYTNEWSVSSPLEMQTVYDSNRNKLKKILLVGNFEDVKASGRSVFWKDKCPVSTCSLVEDVDEIESPDAVIFKGRYVQSISESIKRSPDQVWILYLLESPKNAELDYFLSVFNWTASYRIDSEIVTPYAKFLPYHVAKRYAPTKVKVPTYKNYAVNKTKNVAWFVSNCNTRNRRLEYAEELGTYIDVDIYGTCGTKTCPREEHSKCLEMLDRDYKFYLAFENSNCHEYITEKFFENGLSRNVLPIVMGATREQYDVVAPPHSYIHVNDFQSPKELADYLHELNANDTLYSEYFAWKGTGEFINTHFWCRVCALLHAPHQHKNYRDIRNWWSPPGTCWA